jgi:hypothetical protein
MGRQPGETGTRRRIAAADVNRSSANNYELTAKSESVTGTTVEEQAGGLYPKALAKK